MKNEIIKKIIEMQKIGVQNNLFYKVAEENDLLKLKKQDLILVYNATYNTIYKVR